MTTGLRPKQKLRESEKDRAWRLANLQYIKDLKMTNFRSRRDYELMKLCSGVAEYTDYSYVLNPYKLDHDKYKRWPAKLRNFDFISPIFKRLYTEWAGRNQDPIVYTKNSNFHNIQSNYEKELINSSLQQQFINGLIESGAFVPGQVDAEGQEIEPPMSPEVIKNQVSSLKDLKTIEGQHVLNYIMDEQKVKLKYRKAWEQSIQLNRCFTRKSVLRDKVLLENISAMSLDYFGNKNVEFLEDAEIIRTEYNLNLTEVLEIFQDTFEEDEYKREYGDIIEQLEGIATYGRGQAGFFNTYMKNRHGAPDNNPDIQTEYQIIAQHVCWTSYRLIKRIVDEETGELIDVSEDYQGDDVISTTWYPIQYDGYIIDDRFFVGGYPVPHQRFNPDDPYYSKKEYNGRIFMQGDVPKIRLGEILAHYQEAYNVIAFQIQKTVNKNKDKLLVLPVGLLASGLKNTGSSGKGYIEEDEDGNPIMDPNSIDNSSPINKALYYADATSTLLVDETNEHAAVALNAIKSIDMSLGNYIGTLMDYKAAIRAEAEELVGYNRFRTAQTNTKDAVSNVQQGIYTGSMVTEPYFIEFEEFLATEYQGMLDLGKFAYRVGKVSSYVRSNTDVNVLQVTENFVNSTYGISE